MISIRAIGIPEFVAGESEEFLVISGQRVRPQINYDRHRKVLLSEPYWKSVSQVIPRKSQNYSGDYLLISAPKPSRSDSTIFDSVALDEDIAWLLGIYTAEGFPLSLGKGVEFSLATEEVDLQSRIKSICEKLGFTVKIRLSRSSVNGTVVSVYSKQMSKLFPEICGKGALNKKIPEQVLRHENLKICERFLEGYIAGDGDRHDWGFHAITVSRRLALDVQLLCARLGIPLRVNFLSCAGLALFQDRFIRVHDKYQMYVTSAPSKYRSPKFRFAGEYLLAPVLEIGPSGDFEEITRLTNVVRKELPISASLSS